MSEAPTKYYLKEILSTKFWLPNGKLPPWEAIGGDTGVLSTNAPNLIFHLDNAAAKHVGGVVNITEAQFLEAKKNSTGPELPRHLERQGVSPSRGPTAAPASLFPQPKPTPAPGPTLVAAPVVPVAAAEPAPPQKVRTGRLRKAVTVAPSALP